MRAMLFITLLLPPILWGVLDTLPKVWSNGETIRASDLNSDMSHLHSALDHVENHTIVNADIATNAAIDHTKLATPKLVPKAWTRCAGQLANGAATCITGSGISSVTRVAAGRYDVVMVTTRGADGGTNDYLPQVVSVDTSIDLVLPQLICGTDGIRETHFEAYCKVPAAEVLDGGSSFVDPRNLGIVIYGNGT